MAALREKGQGALEYLLLIGGSVLVAALVIVLVTSAPGSINLGLQIKCGQIMSWQACKDDTDCIPRDKDGAMATGAADFFTCGPSHCGLIKNWGNCAADTACQPVDDDGVYTTAGHDWHCTGA